MRINVFSPLSYTWEKFAELQHQYTMARGRRDVRHFDRLLEVRHHDRIIDKHLDKEAIKKIILDSLFQADYIRDMQKKELERIRYERNFFEHLHFIGLQIRNNRLKALDIRSYILDKYAFELRKNNELHVKKQIENKKLEEKITNKKELKDF